MAETKLSCFGTKIKFRFLLFGFLFKNFYLLTEIIISSQDPCGPPELCADKIYLAKYWAN